MTEKNTSAFSAQIVFCFIGAVGAWTMGAIAIGRGMVDCECSEPSSTPIAAPSTSSTPSPPEPSTSPPPPERWRFVSDPSELLGVWEDAHFGAPTEDGKLVKGGIEMTFEARGSKSKTPFNVKFLAPDDGHMSSETIGGGCGFYPPEGSKALTPMTAFCRGYGLDTEAKALRTSITIERRADRLKFAIDGVLSGELTKGD